MYNGVSIIVLAYNNYEKLDRTILSIYKQKFKKVEVIFSDDSSNNIDKDLIISNVNKVLKNNFEVHFIFNEINLGTVKNFNNAIKKANYDIIVPLSLGDELYDSDTIKQIYDNFNKNSCLIATSFRENINYKNEKKVYPTKCQIDAFNYDLKKYIIRFGNFITGANVYYTKNFFEKFGFFDENYVLLEDTPTIYNSLINNCKIVLFNFIGLKYSTDDGVSNSKKINIKLQNDRNKYIQYILKNENFRNSRFIKFRVKITKAKSLIKKLALCVCYIDVSINYIKMKRREKYGI